MQEKEWQFILFLLIININNRPKVGRGDIGRKRQHRAR